MVNSEDYHWSGKAKTLLNLGYDLLIGPFPVGALAEGADLPHDDTETPYVGGGGELSMGDGFGSRPSDRYLSAVCRILLLNRSLQSPTQSKVGDFAIEVVVD